MEPSKSLIGDSIEYYKKASKDSVQFTNLKLYLLIQNVLKSISFRISMGKPRGMLKKFNRFLQASILLLSTFGLFKYVIPIYYYNEAFPNQDPTSLTVETLNYYDYYSDPEGYWMELPWCQITLLFAVFLPFTIVCILSCTVCIVILVYLKESIKRSFN